MYTAKKEEFNVVNDFQRMQKNNTYEESIYNNSVPELFSENNEILSEETPWPVLPVTHPTRLLVLKLQNNAGKLRTEQYCKQDTFSLIKFPPKILVISFPFPWLDSAQYPVQEKTYQNLRVWDQLPISRPQENKPQHLLSREQYSQKENDLASKEKYITFMAKYLTLMVQYMKLKKQPITLEGRTSNLLKKFSSKSDKYLNSKERLLELKEQYLDFKERNIAMKELKESNTQNTDGSEDEGD